MTSFSNLPFWIPSCMSQICWWNTKIFWVKVMKWLVVQNEDKTIPVPYQYMCSLPIHIFLLFWLWVYLFWGFWLWFFFLLKTPDHIQLHQNIGKTPAFLVFFPLLFNQMVTNNIVTTEFQNNTSEYVFITVKHMLFQDAKKEITGPPMKKYITVFPKCHRQHRDITSK